jgi:hypothetical protein
MRTPFIFILSLCFSAAHAGYLEVPPGEKRSLTVGGFEGPITLKVKNPDGWIEIVPAREDTLTIEATVYGVQRTYLNSPVHLHITDLGPPELAAEGAAAMGKPNRVAIELRYAKAKKMSPVSVVEISPTGITSKTEYKDRGEPVIFPGMEKPKKKNHQGAAHLTIAISPRRLGHLQIDTDAAYILVKGFEKPPHEGFERILRVPHAPKNIDLGDTHGLRLLSDKDEITCAPQLLERAINPDELFGFSAIP